MAGLWHAPAKAPPGLRMKEVGSSPDATRCAIGSFLGALAALWLWRTHGLLPQTKGARHELERTALRPGSRKEPLHHRSGQAAFHQPAQPEPGHPGIGRGDRLFHLRQKFPGRHPHAAGPRIPPACKKGGAAVPGPGGLLQQRRDRQPQAAPMRPPFFPPFLRFHLFSRQIRARTQSFRQVLRNRRPGSHRTDATARLQLFHHSLPRTI